MTEVNRMRCFFSTLIVCSLMIALATGCDNSENGGLAPVGPGTGGAMAGGTMMNGVPTGGNMTGATMAGSMMTGGMTTGGTTTGGMMTGGNNMDGMTTVVPPMDEAGRCLESCMNLLACDTAGVSACGALSRAAFAASCQQSCDNDPASINAVTAGGCGSEANVISTLGLTCEDDSLCVSAMCGEGVTCLSGTCNAFSCSPDMYDTSNNNEQATATELNFEALNATGLSLCAGDRDWYVIDIPPNASLRVDLGFKDEQADVDFKAYNEEGTSILSSLSGSDNERLTFIPSDEMRRVWLEVYVFSAGGSSEMQPAVNETSYNLHISTNLPVPICQVTSNCVGDDLCISDVGVCAPPPPCTSDDECGFNGLCDIPSGRCIDCYNTDDCSSGVCDSSNNSCVSCLVNTDCTDANKPICNPDGQSCVECVADSDCIDGTCNESKRCIPNSCMDVNEPNDDELTATNLTFNGGVAEVQGYICGDNDFFVFNAVGGENLLFTLNFLDETGDLELSVLAPDEQLFTRVTSTDNEIFGYPNALAGQYIVRVYGAGFQVNQYTLRVEQNAAGMVCNNSDQCGGGRCNTTETALCLPAGYCESNRECTDLEPICDLNTNRCKSCSPDSFESNDSIEQSIPAESVGGTLNTCGGPDFFAINASAGQTISVSINFTHMVGDLDMKLYNAEQSIVESSASTIDSETIEHLVEVGGTYFLEVYGYNGVYNDYTMTVAVQ